MKIAIISNLYSPFLRGGAEIIAQVEAESLKKAWQHVFVISTRPRNIKIHGKSIIKPVQTTVSHDEINEVSVWRFTPINIFYYLNDFKYPSFIRLIWHLIDIFNIFSYWTVKKILLKQKPDVVITHNMMGIGFLLPRLFRKLKIKHVHTLHDVQLVTPSGLIIKDKENNLERKFFKFIGYVKTMRWLMGSPDLIVSPSKFLLDFYKRSKFFPKSKQVVLPNPVKGLLNITKQSSHNLELVFLGQVNKSKGVLDLIANFKKLKYKNIRLHIVGVGTDFAKAKKLAGKDKRIKWHGWLPSVQLMPLLAKMDVLVVPSLCYENSPTVIYEALALGIPVLAADIGGVAELVQEGHNGWVFPAGDFDTMNKKINIIYKQRDKLSKLVQNCKQSVDKYHADKYSKKILELIDEIK
jgi:glycosyltransferase involved in cell wall biosynthesis